MKHETHCNSSESCCSDCKKPIDEELVWSTSEQSRIRATSLFLIRSIVERHGGTIEIDLATDTINIDVPRSEEYACALEIEEQVGQINC